MNGIEITYLVTTLANAIAECVSADCLGLLSILFSQLGDTLGTLALIESNQSATQNGDRNTI